MMIVLNVIVTQLPALAIFKPFIGVRVYITTLPRACSSVHINGASYWHCGSVYYQPSGGRYVRVTVY